MQSRRRPYHGNVSPSRRRRFRTRCWLTARLPQRRRLPPHHHQDRAHAHPDPLSRRSLHRDRRPRHMVADTRTTAPTSVLAQAEALDGGEIIEIRCDYLVGCEGGRSETRRVIGAKLHGDTEIGRVQSTFIRASSLLSSLKAKPAWGTFSLNARRSGNVYAIDGRMTWLVHNYLRPDEHDFDAVDRDASLRAILGVGADFDYEVISKEDWIAHRLVADRFRDRRAFICSSLTIWTKKR